MIHTLKTYPMEEINALKGSVLCTGVFDVIHRGHVELFERASELGCPLWVGINSDEAVRTLKGPDRPINCEEDRCYMLEALECIDGVFIISGTTVTEAIRRVRPAHWVKGAGYTLDTLDKGEVAAAKDVGAQIVIIPRFGDYSTTKILAKL